MQKKPRQLARLLTAIAAVILAALCAPGAARAEKLRIMPLGDSITAGYTDSVEYRVPFEFGYRSHLYTLLSEAGYGFELVGQSAEPFHGGSGDPTHGGTVSPTIDLRELGQNGHRGYGGECITGIDARVEAFLTEDDPDIILLLIGINGIGPESQAQLAALVDRVVAASPETHLIVAQITPLASYNQHLFEYNTFIRETLVPQHVEAGHRMSTVDLYQHFLAEADDPTSIQAERLSNGINHPTNEMYDRMAETWFEGIQAVAPPPE